MTNPPLIMLGQGRYRRRYTPRSRNTINIGPVPMPPHKNTPDAFWSLLAALLIGWLLGCATNLIHLFGAWQ